MAPVWRFPGLIGATPDAAPDAALAPPDGALATPDAALAPLEATLAPPDAAPDAALAALDAAPDAALAPSFVQRFSINTHPGDTPGIVPATLRLVDDLLYLQVRGLLWPRSRTGFASPRGPGPR